MSALFSRTRILFNRATSRNIVTIYSKKDCGLCTKLHERLDDLRDEWEENDSSPTTPEYPSFQIETLDITTDTNLYNKYQFTIPVVHINGEYWKQEVTVSKLEQNLADFVERMNKN